MLEKRAIFQMTNELYQEVTDLSQSPPTATDRSDELLTTDQNILQRKKIIVNICLKYYE